MHFEAAAQYRLSQDDLEKSRYGDEISRLRVAEVLAKKGLDLGKKGVAEAVVSDLRVGLLSYTPLMMGKGDVDDMSCRICKERLKLLWKGL
jgi:hypothetical protein